ncbi:hypothetical protein GLOIN_2v1882426 [Rhizophagus irregularis DAOM 181602=DAOM 197198]|nr:hypothetical protein GLOIN_2v1882426 [Rhizophagus irregularis DAOM 181602=DAOM 197198]
MIVEIETKYTTCGKLIGIESSKGILDAWTREESSPNFDYAFIEDLDFGKFSTLICLESGDCLGSTNGSRNCGFKELRYCWVDNEMQVALKIMTLIYYLLPVTFVVIVN